MKWLWIGLGVVLLAVGAAGYVLNSGAPAAPKGVCPALLSAAPVDANIVGYLDLTPLRTAEMASQFGAFEQSPQAASYRDFVEKTNFHLDRDLDHVLLAASTDSGSAALILDGRFDQPRISSYAATAGSMHHYEAGDVYRFQSASPSSSTSMMFLGANRLALAMGRDPDTQILMMADASKSGDAALHEDLCERAQRVAGATFFVLGDVPKTALAQITPVVSRQNPSAAEMLKTLRGWDMAYWMDGDNLRMEVEGEFDGVYDAIQARVAFEKLRATIEQHAAAVKPAPAAANPAGPALDEMVKNLAITLDGRYVRMGTMVKKSDIEKIAAASKAAQH
ncbi:MAG TPA: hypothetical protein VMH00_12480 [Candidatus Limnocylindrales bacterium]|nr:hypothetical protein [Candidatus Limnocylindrales bacterium]